MILKVLMNPIQLNYKNRHYFNYRNKHILLITSAEHYGAVINTAFDFIPYLDTLKKYGFNLTRVFSGSYLERKGDFNIEENTLAPDLSSFICPWEKTHGKYDLDKWDEKYFSRLKCFIKEAFRRDVIVEYTFFCYFYNEHSWAMSPMNPANNINISQNISREAVYLIKNKKILYYQKELIRKVCAELKREPNLYFEIINEPYSNHDSGDFNSWQDVMANEILKTDKGRHMIARNYQNKACLISRGHPAVKIANFHYAEPESVHLNYRLNIAIADDETGFKGQNEAPYRHEAWDFIMSGGSVFNNLDYSYTVNSTAGTAKITGKTPGFGGEKFRRQISFLKKFIEGFDIVRLAPLPEAVTGIGRPFTPDTRPAIIRIMAESGRQYAIYAREFGRQRKVYFGMPAGRYRYCMYDAVTGKKLKAGFFTQTGGPVSLDFKGGSGEFALSIRRTKHER